jgi:hypothetical protein
LSSLPHIESTVVLNDVNRDKKIHDQVWHELSIQDWNLNEHFEGKDRQWANLLRVTLLRRDKTDDSDLNFKIALCPFKLH